MKRFLAMVFFAAAFDASAACSATGCIGYGAEAVVSIYMAETGHAYFEVPSDQRDNLNCTLAINTYMVLERTHPSFKESYAAVLMALVTGRRLQVRTTDGSANCKVAFVRIYNE